MPQGRPINLKGQRFGLLVVDSPIGPLDNKYGRWWNCACDCGESTFSNASDLRSGHKKSCGCNQGALPRGEAAFNYHFSSYKRCAATRGYEFKLSKSLFRSLVTKPCYYCGMENSLKVYKKGLKGHFVGNGVDRVDSSKGYLPDNVVPCCKICNYMKRSLGLEEFLSHINRIANYFDYQHISSLSQCVAG